MEDMFENLQKAIQSMDFNSISESRKNELDALTLYVQRKVEAGSTVFLNFICTHNSRRSQFAQLWAAVAADYYGISLDSYSGGVEVTAFNHRAVESLQRFGFDVHNPGGENPRYKLRWRTSMEPLVMYSKLFADDTNPSSEFAAVMTCSDADQNCPFVPGCEQRISLPFHDPKDFDDTPIESEKYDERSLQIATELFYTFSKIKN